VPVTVTSRGTASVRVGANGSLGNIQAAVTVMGAPNTIDLTVDDSADKFADRQITLSDTALTISPITVINYSPNAITSLTLEGGPGSSGANVYHVLNTPAGQTTIRMRGGHDFMQIYADQGPLLVGGFANNSVLVGNAGSLGGIRAPVSVANIANLTVATLTVDDSADTFADRQVTLTATALTIAQPGLVTINHSTITSLAVNGGRGDDVFQIVSTPAGVAKPVNGGGGNGGFAVADGVGVGRIAGRLRLDGQAG